MNTVTTSSSPFVDHLLDFYARFAESYDEWDSGVHGKAAERCAQLAAASPAMRLLDVGCGTGLVTHRLAAAGGQVVGVDLSPAMLEQARRSRGDATFLQMDARDLYLQDAAFDAVTLCQVLSYQLHPQRVLDEVRRVLRRGGRLVVCCQQRSLATPAERLFFRGLDSLVASGMRIPRPPDHNALFGEPWALRHLLESSGFVEVRITNLVVGNHTDGAAAWIDLMRGAGPYPDALIGVLGGRARAQLEAALGLSSRDDEGAFQYHRAFTFAVADRV